MQFRVGKRAMDSTSVPATLRPLPSWVADAAPNPQISWDISISSGLLPTWLINGKTFDPSRVETTAELDSTVTWQLRNRTAVAHLMHLHAADWYMLSRNGKRPPAAGALPEGNLPARGRRINRRCRPLLRLPGQVRRPLPHARPRGPRPHVAVRGDLRAPSDRAFTFGECPTGMQIGSVSPPGSWPASRACAATGLLSMPTTSSLEALGDPTIRPTSLRSAAVATPLSSGSRASGPTGSATGRSSRASPLGACSVRGRSRNSSRAMRHGAL